MVAVRLKWSQNCTRWHVRQTHVQAPLFKVLRAVTAQRDPPKSIRFLNQNFHMFWMQDIVWSEDCAAEASWSRGPRPLPSGQALGKRGAQSPGPLPQGECGEQSFPGAGGPWPRGARGRVRRPEAQASAPVAGPGRVRRPEFPRRWGPRLLGGPGGAGRPKTLFPPR